jgi:hypothetical protein
MVSQSFTVSDAKQALEVFQGGGCLELEGRRGEFKGYVGHPHPRDRKERRVLNFSSSKEQREIENTFYRRWKRNFR